MKWFHNDKMALGWAIFVELVVHALFAFQAFLLGGFLGEIALSAFFGKDGAVIGAWALAIFIFGAAFQAFVLGEYMKEHVLSYERSGKGDGSYIRSWKRVRWLVACIELSSLLFRVGVVLQQGDTRQGVVVALFGIIALWYAFAQAKVIHASVNRPVTYDVMRAQQEAGRSLVKDAMEYVDDMSPEQKARFVGGDVTAIEEVAQARFFEEEQQRQAREQSRVDKQQARQTKRLRETAQEDDAQEQARQAGETASHLFDPAMWRRKDAPKDVVVPFRGAQPNSQAERLSQNGRH